MYIKQTVLFSYCVGGVVDVGKLMSQLSKSEMLRSSLELQLADSLKSLTCEKEVSSKHSASKDKFQVILFEESRLLFSRLVSGNGVSR